MLKEIIKKQVVLPLKIKKKEHVINIGLIIVVIITSVVIWFLTEFIILEQLNRFDNESGFLSRFGSNACAAQESPSGIKLFVAKYGDMRDDEARFIAPRFDLIDGDFFNVKYVQEIKESDPGITAIGYLGLMGMQEYQSNWNEVKSHEDWFMHDQSGRRLIEDIWGWHLMDPYNAGWRDYFVDYAKKQLSQYASFDGIFLDDVWPVFYPSRFHVNITGEIDKVNADGKTVNVNELIFNSEENKIKVLSNREGSGINYYEGGSFSGHTITLGTPLEAGAEVYVNYGSEDPEKIVIDPNKINQWQQQIGSFLEKIKASLNNKLIIVNAGGTGSEYLGYVDGKMLEGFIHASWYSDGYFMPYYDWEK